MKNPGKSKLVYGVGVNDSGYPVSVYAVIGGKNRQLWACPFYQAWKGMLQRCYSPKSRVRWNTYIGCSVAPDWHSFMAFREWMLAQDHEGNDMDKDILFPGNKIYSPDSCVFVSHKLNSFILDCHASRGEWPLGVYWKKDSGKFKAACCNPFTGKQEYLGYFADPSEAHEAWRKRKHEHACRYADQQSDPRVAAALRTRYALRPAHRLDE